MGLWPQHSAFCCSYSYTDPSHICSMTSCRAGSLAFAAGTRHGLNTVTQPAARGLLPATVRHHRPACQRPVGRRPPAEVQRAALPLTRPGAVSERGATSGQASRTDDGVYAGARCGPAAVLGDVDLPPMVIERGKRRLDRDLYLTGRGSRGSRGLGRLGGARPATESRRGATAAPIRRTICSTDPGTWTYRQTTRS